MRLLSNQKFLAAVGVFLLSIAAHAAVPVKAQHHHNAKLLVQAKLKQDGHHEIDRKGKHPCQWTLKAARSPLCT